MWIAALCCNAQNLNTDMQALHINDLRYVSDTFS